VQVFAWREDVVDYQTITARSRIVASSVRLQNIVSGRRRFAHGMSGNPKTFIGQDSRTTVIARWLTSRAVEDDDDDDDDDDNGRARHHVI
jgi:hypothetical protein